jgi:putative CRISPR-associated protein (TIGR02619 family)
MNLLLVTVGTSAIENCELGRAPDGRDNAALQADIQRYMRDPYKRPERWAKLADDIFKAHQRYWDMPDDYTGNKLNFKQTSAELTSTVLLLRREALLPVHLALLSSDTEECWFAAKINERVLQYIYRKKVDEIRVEAVRVPKLDLEFHHTTQSLAEVVSAKRESGRDQVIVNFTGGYKGTVPSITYLALEGRWLLYYQHESQKRGVYLQYKAGRLVESEQGWRLT